MKRSVLVLGAAASWVLTLAGCSSNSTSSTAGSSASVSGAADSSAGATAAATTAAAPVPSGSPVADATTTFNGVTVSNAIDLTKEPKVSSSSTDNPTVLATKDLVIGSGTAATPASTVEVQYTGFRLKDGFVFDSSWSRNQSASFPLTGVVPGFTQGIGGNADVAGMKEGGRRIMILPAALGYGATGTSDGSIPPNAPIVFVVDLLHVS